jgi:hypothetical protein
MRGLVARDVACLAVIGGKGDVFEQRKLAERPWDLERARDALVADGCAGSPPISLPAKRIEPAVGDRLPAIRLNVVLLPEPLGPMRPRISPSRTSKDT